MPIPESQLETWAHQGSITQSSTTYGTVKRALAAASAPYSGTAFSTFLQGSYANDTNIYADSDVDVVIQLQSAYYSDDSALPEAMRAARRGAHQSAAYGFPEFKLDVLGRLRSAFGGDIHPGAKAVFVAGSGGRRDADVLIAVTFKRFVLYDGHTAPSFIEGLCFFTPDGKRVVNYPKLHSANCTAKHQTTTQWYKPTVRIFKNMRNRAVESGLLQQGASPSYFLEGLLYNVPDASFGRTYGATVVNILNWLLKCDRSALVCANRQFYLLRDASSVSWAPAQFEVFLKAMISQWNNW